MDNTNEVNDTELEQTNKENQPTKKKRTVKPIRKFPKYSIEEIINIPTLIKENNGGNPWNTDQLALGLGIKRGGDTFYYMTAASRDYGFTIGTRESDSIELADLGRKLVYAQSQEDIDECRKAAFFNIEIFKKVYDYYKGNEPTDDTFFKNALYTTFNLEECFHTDFIKNYRDNVKYISKISTSPKNVISDNNNIHIKSQIASTTDKKLFVIMPFTEKTGKYPAGFFKEVFRQLIFKSAENEGYIAETADKDGSDIIHSTIIKAISGANIILADLTEHNPNVLFELGIAIALRKPVVLIKTECTGQIFDIDNTIRVFSYNQNLWPSTLEKDIPYLSKRIKSVADNIGKEKSYFDTFMGTV